MGVKEKTELGLYGRKKKKMCSKHVKMFQRTSKPGECRKLNFIPMKLSSRESCDIPSTCVIFVKFGVSVSAYVLHRKRRKSCEELKLHYIDIYIYIHKGGRMFFAI